MLGFFTDMISDAIDITIDTITLEGPKREQVVRLLASGVTVYAAAELLGLAVDVVQDIANEP